MNFRQVERVFEYLGHHACRLQLSEKAGQQALQRNSRFHTKSRGWTLRLRTPRWANRFLAAGKSPCVGLWSDRSSQGYDVIVVAVTNPCANAYSKLYGLSSVDIPSIRSRRGRNGHGGCSQAPLYPLPKLLLASLLHVAPISSSYLI